MRFLVCLLFLCSGSLNAEEVGIKGLAWPGLSRDGREVAFEWLGDIWVGPVEGGEARRVIKSPAKEAYPQFTSDGKRLVFSSERTGSAQVWSSDPDGGNLRQHTHHTEGNVLEAVSADGNFAIARGERGASGYKPVRLLRVDLRKDARQVPLFDATAHSVSVSPDGHGILFCRGGEQLYRKGYRGSRAGTIHLFDESKQTFREIVGGDTEARSPMWVPGENSFYYISSKGEGGVFNVWKRDLGTDEDVRLTNFGSDGVILPTLSRDGSTMVFRVAGDLYRFEPQSGVAPVKVEFFTKEKLPDRSTRKEKVTGTSSMAMAPDGKHVLFSAAGDLWTAKSEGKERRCTETDDADERDPVFSKDGAQVFFLKDDGTRAGIWRAKWTGERVSGLDEIRGSERSKKSLRLSPDGSRLSWIEATGDLMTMPVEGGEPVRAMAAWDTPTYDWSPDGKWVVVAAKDKQSNRDIFVVAADGGSEPVNLTRHPAFEGFSQMVSGRG